MGKRDIRAAQREKKRRNKIIWSGIALLILVAAGFVGWSVLRPSVGEKIPIMANAGEHYRLKIWPSTALEPQTWTLIGEQPFGRPESGSLLLVAHHVDITFGNLEITTLP